MCTCDGSMSYRMRTLILPPAMLRLCMCIHSSSVFTNVVCTCGGSCSSNFAHLYSVTPIIIQRHGINGLCMLHFSVRECIEGVRRVRMRALRVSVWCAWYASGTQQIVHDTCNCAGGFFTRHNSRYSTFPETTRHSLSSSSPSLFCREAITV